MLNINKTDHLRHHVPETLSDRIADGAVRALFSIAGAALFGRRYGDRVIVLETIAAVPAMVAATVLHLKCLRRMIDDRGWVRAFMDEAENQRAHLMSFVAIARPSTSERLLIAVAQGIFYNADFLLYLISPRTAHRLAAISPSARCSLFRIPGAAGIGRPAQRAGAGPARAYWNLAPDARLSDMILAMREDEAIHRDINHAFADALAAGNVFPERPTRFG